MTPLPVLSIVIPTRNRHEYLAHLCDLLIHVLEKSSDLEVVISENSDQYNPALFPHHPMLRVVRPDRILSMVDNWEYAVAASRGNYVAFVGDDDGIVLEGVQNAIEILRDCDADAVVFNSPSFFWPGVVGKSGRLTAWIPKRQRLSIIETRTKLSASFFDEKFPTPHSRTAVSRKFLSKLIDRQGRVFNSRIPDINLGWSIIVLAGKILFSTESPFMVGTGPKSNGVLHGQDAITPEQVEFWSSGTLPWDYRLGGIGRPTVSYLVYFEPLVRTLTSLGVPFNINNRSLFLKSFFSTLKTKDLTAYLLANFPRHKLSISFMATMARVSVRQWIFLRRSVWAASRLSTLSWRYQSWDMGDEATIVSASRQISSTYSRRGSNP